jgi:hypothetical protein
VVGADNFSELHGVTQDLLKDDFDKTMEAKPLSFIDNSFSMEPEGGLK